MALLASNIILTIMNFPLDIIGSVYSSWWLSSAACNLYLYGNWVLEGGMMHMHVLITANRIWAMQFPVSYKTHHGSSKRTGLFLILLAWIYVHVVCLPGVVLDALYYRQPPADGCSMNDVQVEWINTAQFLVYDMPVLFIVFAYPFLLLKQLQRNRKSLERRGTLMVSHAPSRMSPSNGQDGHHAPLQRRKSVFSKETTRAFLVLTVVTASVFICWTPSQIWWTIKLANSRIQLPDIFYKVTSALYGLQAVIDPLLFVVTFKDLRDVVLDGVKEGWRCGREQRRRTSIWSSNTARGQVHPA
ncbi:octopamine receptor beta-2R-like [Paramacrobiotus metropolitanus]|uniref:octopamine receptor beta-2R-like n=1 Tax=Paramacrobiotus metropolitanus TaxID=2943436 RepID=UPI002445B7F8|nr:octopamine receptor beta-2R-like [Paramacrobiotus metropolitanus]